MKIILAVDRDFGIGKDNKLLFRLKKDLAHFKKLTLNNIVIMGRKTYESMGGGLPRRENIVLTRNKDYKINDGLVFNNVVKLLSYLEKNKNDRDIFVIGGNEIVELLLSFCDEAIITKIDTKKDADTFLHNFDNDKNFEIYKESDIINENDTDFKYVYYRRKS
ncbi:dihydrofolate reductase [Anaerococcus sp. AGMB00486]|uniref:dihydrofolate reductase n=1 Tax=Anaerococcus faecalis TaxID=2742993 RepID=A0ABX2NCQ3_9FIRM|nr:dihydrofolate reductase [Anaerococcus faecalis]NVF12501.1 dihydrofolate reductase [Anaerococcus faecalis]